MLQIEAVSSALEILPIDRDFILSTEVWCKLLKALTEAISKPIYLKPLPNSKEVKLSSSY